jgi:cytochrome c553
MTDRHLRPALVAAAGLALAATLVAAPARAVEGLIFSGSVFVDEWAFLDSQKAAKASPQGLAPMASMKVGADVNDNLSFQAKACIGCHGIDMEHVVLDYQPRTYFNVQAGRLSVPFGEFTSRADPTSYRTGSQPLIYDMGRMAYGSRTAMNLGVVPMPYVDTGVLLYGVKWLGTRVQAWYGGYAVGGLKGANDVDWMALRTAPYNDNNAEPAYGGRLTLSYSADAGDFIGDASFGGSYMSGKYDRDAKLGYEAFGADATVRLAMLIFRGEYARRKTDLDPNAAGYPYALKDPFFVKEGYYVELEHPLGKYLNLVYRYDDLKRTGTPLPGAPAEMTSNSRFKRYTGGIVLTPAQNLVVKASWEYWDTSDFGRFNTIHAGIGGAF